MSSSSDMEQIHQLKSAISKLDISAQDSAADLARAFDSVALNLAKDEQLRRDLGANHQDVWTDLRKLWRELVHFQLTFWDGNDSGEDEITADDQVEINRQASLQNLCAALGRFTRNLVAGVPENQQKAFENEPQMRRLLHYYTSWTAQEDKGATLAGRIISQAITNLITGNETLKAKLWSIYMGLPEDQSVLIRLLSSNDRRTALAALYFMKNCLDGDSSRMKIFCAGKAGSRLTIQLLDLMVKVYDADEGTDSALVFDTGYSIFSALIQQGLVSELYTRLTMSEEIITPQQTTLLKILDSYLQAAQLGGSSSFTPLHAVHISISPMLSSTFFGLSTYAQKAIQRSVGNDPSNHTASPPAELDVMLPKVCEALVLVAQCIISITLGAEEFYSRNPTLPVLQPDLKGFFNEQTEDLGTGMVESLVGLMRLLDVFLPRINFGKPVPVGGRGSNTSTSAVPLAGEEGFSYLKRDLVRLLGILCHSEKAVQDRTRQAGGIQVVMNMCVVDERNPYLREHAIFTLHNLLQGNAENQKIVDDIKPAGQWDENGVLRDTVGAVRK